MLRPTMHVLITSDNLVITIVFLLVSSRLILTEHQSKSWYTSLWPEYGEMRRFLYAKQALCKKLFVSWRHRMLLRQPAAVFIVLRTQIKKTKSVFQNRCPKTIQYIWFFENETRKSKTVFQKLSLYVCFFNNCFFRIGPNLKTGFL